MTNKSTVTAVHKASGSIRTTIPVEIAKQIKLAAGDVLDWSIEVKKNKKFIIVRKLELGH